MTPPFMLTVLWSRNNFTHSERLFPYLFHPHISYWKNLGLVSHSPRSSGPIQEQRARALPCATSVESEPHAASILRLQTAIGLAPHQNISTYFNICQCLECILFRQHGKATWQINIAQKKVSESIFSSIYIFQQIMRTQRTRMSLANFFSPPFFGPPAKRRIRRKSIFTAFARSWKGPGGPMDQWTRHNLFGPLW